MHRTFGSGGGAALYVNGIAVAATNQGYATGDQAGAALDIVIGAGLNRTSNFFPGQLDEFTIGVAGNNTPGQPGGRNYGNFTLATDNDFVRQNLVGVNPGDINRDSLVNTIDINTFITNWRRVQQVNGVTVGDLNSRLFGDLNMNGTVDIDDAYTLHSALRAAGWGGAGLQLARDRFPSRAAASWRCSQLRWQEWHGDDDAKCLLCTRQGCRRPGKWMRTCYPAFPKDGAHFQGILYVYRTRRRSDRVRRRYCTCWISSALPVIAAVAIVGCSQGGSGKPTAHLSPPSPLMVSLSPTTRGQRSIFGRRYGSSDQRRSPIASTTVRTPAGQRRRSHSDSSADWKDGL